MELERAVVFGGVTQIRAGLACATVVVLSTLGVTAYTASLGQGLWGLAAVFAEVGTIGGVFIYSTKKNAEERAKKAKSKAKPEETPAIEEK